MLSLTYISTAARTLADHELVQLLKHSRENNARRNITGLLIYDGRDTFIQVLEGPDNAVRELYTRLSQDPRHEYIYCLAEQTITRRAFPDWRMAFKVLGLTSGELSSLDGFSEFMQPRTASGQLPLNTAFIFQLVDYFKQHQQALRQATPEIQ